MNTNPTDSISAHLSAAIKNGKSILMMDESRVIVDLAGIPLNKSGLAKSWQEAVELAKEIGFPLVMKVVSPQVVHKTDAGGVKINITTEDEVIKSYNEINISVKEKYPDAEIKGVLLEEMVHGPEFIVGTAFDSQFGHMIMFGVGGIFVEVYKDVTFRLVPITAGDAKDMLNEIKGKPLLEGVRGLPKADNEQLINILMKVSNLVNTHPNIREMDLNPIVATEDGIVAVDVKIVLSQPEETEGEGGVKEMIEQIRKINY